MYNCCAVYSPPDQNSGGTGTGFTAVVANYSALPAAASASGEFYYVENAQGTSWLPGSLGGTYYPPGTYYSTGSSWITGISPYQATLADVNTGTITDQFVSPYTFTNASKWATKQDVLSGTGLVYSTAGSISYYTTTGSGTVAALQTSPVFVTNITTPAILGGSAVGSYVDIIGTSGNGTTTSAGITFRVGNNGGTTAGTIYHSGQLRCGTTTAPGGSLAIPVRIGSGTNTIDIGSYSASFAAIWFNQATPSITNFAFLGNSNDTYLNGVNSVYFTISGVGKLYQNANGLRVGDSSTPGSRLDVAGSFGAAYVAKTANYTATMADFTIDCTANSFTVTLPSAVGIPGRIYNIKNSGTITTITLATTSSQTIDGSLTQTINGLECFTVQSNGANWIVI